MGALRRVGLGDTGPTSLELPARFNSPMDLANVNVPDFRRKGLGGGGGSGLSSDVDSIPLSPMSDERGDDVVAELISISTNKLRDFLNSPRRSGGTLLLLIVVIGVVTVDKLYVLSSSGLSVPSLGQAGSSSVKTFRIVLVPGDAIGTKALDLFLCLYYVSTSLKDVSLRTQMGTPLFCRRKYHSTLSFLSMNL